MKKQIKEFWAGVSTLTLIATIGACLILWRNPHGTDPVVILGWMMAELYAVSGASSLAVFVGNIEAKRNRDLALQRFYAKVGRTLAAVFAASGLVSLACGIYQDIVYPTTLR